jgi:hypothetical protein
MKSSTPLYVALRDRSDPTAGYFVGLFTGRIEARDACEVDADNVTAEAGGNPGDADLEWSASGTAVSADGALLYAIIPAVPDAGVVRLAR